MNNLRLLVIFVIFVLVGLGTMWGCDPLSGVDWVGPGANKPGETNCTDGIDNEGDNIIDCEDVECHFDPVCFVPEVPSCDDIKIHYCQRSAQCDKKPTNKPQDLELRRELCLLELEEVIEGSGFDCEEIFNLPNARDCSIELYHTGCRDLDIAPPASCSPVGACDICDTDNDCIESQTCFECLQDCTGVVNRCSSFLPNRCEDGIF